VQISGLHFTAPRSKVGQEFALRVVEDQSSVDLTTSLLKSSHFMPLVRHPRAYLLLDTCIFQVLCHDNDLHCSVEPRAS
jgi:hypothetical protein